MTELHEDNVPESSFLAFNFQDDEKWSNFTELTCDYDVTESQRSSRGGSVLLLSRHRRSGNRRFNHHYINFQIRCQTITTINQHHLRRFRRCISGDPCSFSISLSLNPSFGLFCMFYLTIL